MQGRLQGAMCCKDRRPMPAFLAERAACSRGSLEGFWTWKLYAKWFKTSWLNATQKSRTGCLVEERDLSRCRIVEFIKSLSISYLDCRDPICFIFFRVASIFDNLFLRNSPMPVSSPIAVPSKGIPLVCTFIWASTSGDNSAWSCTASSTWDYERTKKKCTRSDPGSETICSWIVRQGHKEKLPDWF